MGKRKTTEQFIEEAIGIHGYKYNYSLVNYINNKSKVKIVCKEHGVFKQKPHNHLINSHGCPICVGKYNKYYFKNNIPTYETFSDKLTPYGVSCRKNSKDLVILEVKCMYCGNWFIPKHNSVRAKVQSINGTNGGEGNLYCSGNCKKSCPTFGQKLYPKGFKKATSREVQPQLRKLVLKRDNYKCQICEVSIEEAELHCHHITGIEQNPIESADVDNCITLCKKHHKQVHKLPDCGNNELRCMK